MTLRWTQVIVDSEDPGRLGRWWAQALGWSLHDDGDVEVRPPVTGAPTLLFLSVPERKSVKNRLHLDFIPDDQEAEVRRLESLGATRVDVGQGDDVTWVVLADPEGNEFCILRSGQHASPDVV